MYDLLEDTDVKGLNMSFEDPSGKPMERRWKC